MRLVPLVDFSQRWTDEKVYDLLDLTEAERNAIDTFLHDYYGRNKVRTQSEEDDSLIDERGDTRNR